MATTVVQGLVLVLGNVGSDKDDQASGANKSIWGRTVRCARAVPALCEKLAVFHHW